MCTLRLPLCDPSRTPNCICVVHDFLEGNEGVIYFTDSYSLLHSLLFVAKSYFNVVCYRAYGWTPTPAPSGSCAGKRLLRTMELIYIIYACVRCGPHLVESLGAGVGNCAV